MSDIKELQSAAKGINILYVDDNESLRNNVTKLLKKFFAKVYVGKDGADALEVFKKHHPHIVITDIKMPKMDGIAFAKKVKHIRPDCKLIFMSAFDDKEYLYESIAVGAYSFLKKPVNVTKLTGTLLGAVKDLKHDHRVKLFYTQLKNIFNYQSSMVMMINGEKITIANQVFLDFFDVSDIEEFEEQYKGVGSLCLEHDGFLYNHDDVDCLNVLQEEAGKLHHIKIKNAKGNIRHLIMKLQKVEEKEHYNVVSFEDVTELNLMKLFDERQSKNDDNLGDQESMLNLLDVIQRNNAKIQIHNYYKGLSITNDAIITDILDNSVTIKTNFLQQKAVQYEKRCFIVSEALPNVLACETVSSISFDTQSIVLKDIHFSKTSPITRKTVRVSPLETHSVSLFIGENKFQGDVHIEDLSLDAVKLKLNALPAGFVEGTEVIIDMVLELDKRPLIVNSKAKMYRKSEARHSFSTVYIFDLKTETKKNLVKYITKRQMAIIREFKGLQNG